MAGRTSFGTGAHEDERRGPDLPRGCGRKESEDQGRALLRERGSCTALLIVGKFTFMLNQQIGNPLLMGPVNGANNPWLIRCPRRPRKWFQISTDNIDDSVCFGAHLERRGPVGFVRALGCKFGVPTTNRRT